MIWRLAVAGYPIEHSLSPALHEAGLRLAGLEGSSGRVALKDDEIDRLGELLATTYDAMSITMPLKSAAVALCATLDGPAQRTGVVNSLLVRDGAVHGACTDGDGFLDSLRGELGVDVTGRHAVVLGAGGAARGIVDALVHAGVDTVSILGRTPTKVDALSARYANVQRGDLGSRPVDLVVNTIPVTGRGPDAEVLAGVGTDTIAVDIAYEPRLTPWRSLYVDAGCRTANGLAMLAYQAARQMQWWWGVAMDGARLLEVIQ